MAIKPFEANYHPSNDPRTEPDCLALSGYLDANTVPDFEEVIEQIREAGVTRLMLDLAGLEYISSAGIGALMALLHELKRRDGVLVVVQPQPRVRSLLDMLGFADIFQIASSRGEAATLLSPADPA